MSSPANVPLIRRRNPRRTCRSSSEILTQPIKPVSGDNASPLHSKGNSVSQELNLAESLGLRSKKGKSQAANQSALSDSLTCLNKSTRKATRINGHVSSNSHEPESRVPQNPSTPKCASKTSQRGRKKKNIHNDLNKVAFTKLCDNSADSSCPGQHLSSQKTIRTRDGHSTKSQNHQTPSAVSTGLHTCITIPSSHTNRSHTKTCGRLLSSSSISSPISDLQLLSPKRAENLRKSRVVKTPPTTNTPPRRVTSQRFVAAGRQRGRKKKNKQEQPSVSPPVKRRRRGATSSVVSPQEEPAIEMQTPSRPYLEIQEPKPEESADQTMSSDLSIELSLQEEPHSLNGSVFSQEEEEDQEDDEEELPSFFRQENKKPFSESISEGLCVWCKMRKYPYWPAVVKSVNRKSKKASIVFIDCYIIDQKGVRKGFYVSLRTLKPFDCEEYEKFVDTAKEKYGSAITWSLELISDYRIRIGCGSFSGSFIEYCAADISCPVRRKYSERKSVLTFPSQEILSEQRDISDTNTKDIVEEEQDELFKKVLPDRTKAARNRANKELVDFIIRQNVEKRLKAVISGCESSKWMQALHKPNHSRPVVDVYLEDEEQVDKVYRYLSKVCDSTPQINTCLENIQVDRIRLILDVLLPEAIIHAIAGVHKLSLEKAEEKYRRGPCFSNRERQEFDMMIEQQMKLKEITISQTKASLS